MALDLPTIFRNAARTAFSLADSVMTDATLNVNPSGTLTISDYNTSTGTANVTPATFPVRGMIYQSEAQKLAQDSSEVASFMIEVAEAERVGLTIDPTDSNAYLTAHGVRYHIESVKFDPAAALYIFALRVS